MWSAVIALVSVLPHEHFLVSTPFSVQVADLVTVQPPNEWPVAGITSVFVSPQAHLPVLTPVDSWPAAVVTFHVYE